MHEILEQIKADPRYQANLDWGKPRHGHPEGTVRGHIEQLERNLAALKPRISEEEHARLLLLIHVHDSFKASAKHGVPISHPESHASLARAFLSEFSVDADLLSMVQFHDEPFALWRQFDDKARYNPERMNDLLSKIKDWDLFLLFLIVDGCTEGKDRAKLLWFFNEVHGRVQSRIDAGWILP